MDCGQQSPRGEHETTAGDEATTAHEFTFRFKAEVARAVLGSQNHQPHSSQSLAADARLQERVH
jgi:hypothetical protein